MVAAELSCARARGRSCGVLLFIQVCKLCHGPVNPQLWIVCQPFLCNTAMLIFLFFFFFFLPSFSGCLKETSQLLIQILTWQRLNRDSQPHSLALISGVTSVGFFFVCLFVGFRGCEWVCGLTRQVLLLMQVIHGDVEMR